MPSPNPQPQLSQPPQDGVMESHSLTYTVREEPGSSPARCSGMGAPILCPGPLQQHLPEGLQCAGPGSGPPSPAILPLCHSVPSAHQFPSEGPGESLSDSLAHAPLPPPNP